MLELVLSPITGYCFGVKRAMRLIEEGLGRGERNIYTIGDVIHNKQAVERLRSRGVTPVSSIEGLSEGDTLVIRAHGAVPELIERAREKGAGIIDATCPFVQKSQNYVRDMAHEDRRVIIIGDAAHPEVRAIYELSGRDPVIIDTPGQAQELEGIERAGVVIQTTFSRDKAKRIIEELEAVIPDIRIHDTICQATVLRREATLRLAGEVDLVLVIGGKGSSNTKRLYQMCLDRGISARFIETADEIDPSWFGDGDRVGLTTGTSTPDWVIEDVLSRLREISDC